jgi:hypothetical protein
MREIRGMGESNALVERLPGLARRDVLLRAAEIYQDNFADREGRVPASLEILYLTAWSPGPEQPRALAPGSGQARLSEALEPPPEDEGA